MSFRDQLLKKQQKRKASWNIIELDYALSWVLAAIGDYQPAKENLIFKGGTCLKKCYFGESYRFSEDLDFTTNPQITERFLDNCVEQIVTLATKLSAQKGGGVEYSAELYQEKTPHPFNQKAYMLRARFPFFVHHLIVPSNLLRRFTEIQISSPLLMPQETSSHIFVNIRLTQSQP